MKAVILAAGRGTRMGDLTLITPKPMLLHRGKNLIEHKLEALPEHINEVVIVIGYLGDKIKNHFSNVWHGKKIHYVEQKELLGTAHSLFSAKHLLNEPFIVLMGDDLYEKEDLKLLTSSDGWAILVEKSKEPQGGGNITVDEHGNLKEITERASHVTMGTIYTGACLLTPDIFELEMAQLPNSKEFGLPQTFARVAHLRPIKVHHAKHWKRITSPQDLN